MAIYKHDYQEQYWLVIRVGLEQLTSRFHVPGPNLLKLQCATELAELPNQTEA